MISCLALTVQIGTVAVIRAYVSLKNLSVLPQPLPSPCQELILEHARLTVAQPQAWAECVNEFKTFCLATYNGLIPNVITFWVQFVAWASRQAADDQDPDLDRLLEALLEVRCRCLLGSIGRCTRRTRPVRHRVIQSYGGILGKHV